MYKIGKSLEKELRIGDTVYCRYSGLAGTVTSKYFDTEMGKKYAIIVTLKKPSTRPELDIVPYITEKHFQGLAKKVGILSFLKDVWVAFKNNFIKNDDFIKNKDLLIKIQPKEQ